MKLKISSIALFTSIVFYSCDSSLIQSSNANNVIEQSITNKKWKITLLNSEKIQGDEKDFYLKLNSNSNQLEAKAGCNQLFGEFQIKDNFISFSKIGSTKMYCGDTMAIENSFIAILSQTSKVVVIDSSKFILLSDDIVIPQGETVQGLDIGIGANCIYPIIGNGSYGWSFVGTDIDENAIQNCKKIIQNNSKLIDAISLQLQTESRFIFKNIITPEDKFAFTVCNPPFHKSEEEANKGTLRKISNLKQQKTKKVAPNFGGQNGELWCDGGELRFITQMIYESVKYTMNCMWFTTLVSKKENLASIYKTLNKVNAVQIKTIDMAQGQKTSRFVAWTFMTLEQRKNWQF